MEEKEFKEAMANMDIIEVMIREKEAKELVAQGKIEDALAYCMANGFRMGWYAYKKKVEENNK